MARALLHGVVSLLDLESTSRVTSIWWRLEHEFGLRGVLVMPYPHFSYQVVGNYDRPSVESALERLARETRPFTIRTSGLSTFDGHWPVVYITVENEPALRAVHERVWESCLPHAQDALPYYQPESWVPHITLAHGDERNTLPLAREVVQRVLVRLRTSTYLWEITIDNFALVWDDGTVQRPVRSFPLVG